MTVVIKTAILGLPSSQLPDGGVRGVAVWPIIESKRKSPSVAVNTMRRQLSWLSLMPHSVDALQLKVVGAPAWVRWAIARRRARVGLNAAEFIQQG
jgi:hypothetical protein